MDVGDKSISEESWLGSRKPHFKIGDILYEYSSTYNGKSNFNKQEFDKNWICVVNGLVIYKDPFCKLLNALIHMLRITPPFTDFKEMAFPRVIPRSTVEKFNLIELWPYYLFTVQEYCRNTREFFMDEPQEYFLDPVQCAMFYEYLASEEIALEKYPIKIREVLGGWSYRNEKKTELRPIIKDPLFLRYEFAFAGGRDDVLDIRVLLVNGLCSILQNIGLSYRVVVGEGCYDQVPNEFYSQIENARSPKTIPVIDILVYIPIQNIWLEIAGCSYLGKEKISRFLTTNTDCIESGCMGIGLSRMAYSIVTNRGLVSDHWPEILKNVLF
jgi:seryl-tRNA synthetase